MSPKATATNGSADALLEQASDAPPPQSPATPRTAALALAAMGVVYGDIGTSPLYAIKECVHGSHSVAATHANVLGILSLIFWGITLVVCVKYLAFITRANNHGEGGILALLALIPESKRRPALGRLGLLTSLILFGSALLYGDGMITPAISVLSAVEGLEVATETLKPAVLPITVVILFGLFALQRRGTNSIGSVFGPIVVVWFLTIGGLGVAAITTNPAVYQAFNPMHAARFFAQNGYHGFVVLGSVFLCITGGEALYADMGHFGRRPIMLAWYGLAMPALLLNYFGQGALLLSADGEELVRLAKNPFFGLVSSGPAIYPLVALSAVATCIASQAMISGAFSLTRQAVQLGYLPRVTVTHTSSDTEGQIYIPEVNWALAIGCIGLVLTFKESTKLAAAYGIAVTGTMAITSLAFFTVARRRWGWSLTKIVPLVALFLAVDLAFLGANAIKLLDGGFVPVVIALLIYGAMRIWKRGRALLGKHFAAAARPLDQFLEALGHHVFNDPDGEIPVVRVPGVAVFLTSNPTGTPPLMLHHVRHNKCLHETVILVNVTMETIPRVMQDRYTVEPITEGFYRARIRVGFMETPDVPDALERAFKQHALPFTTADVTYFLGRETLLATDAGEMSARAETVFAFLTRNSQTATRYFNIPGERVVEIGMQIDL